VSPDGGEPSRLTPVEQYDALKEAGDNFAALLRKGVLKPVAKQHFENDNGIPVNQVLPDRTEEYGFECLGFEALILPDERRVLNYAYNGTPISASGIIRDPDAFKEIVARGEALWNETYGEHIRGRTQSGHPGPYPMSGDNIQVALDHITKLHDAVVSEKSLSVVVKVARDENYGLLAELFDTTQTEVFTPGGTDLSALTRPDEIHVPYNDGTIAVLRPTREHVPVGSPTRGCVIGHDDTPVGIFAHVIDVTNLQPEQETTHAAVRDAMGFDTELDPWNPPDALNAAAGERVRLQGDLRVERTENLEGFPAEIARTARINQYRDLVETALNGVVIPSEFIWQRRTALPVGQVLDVTVSPDGGVTLDPNVSDSEIELLAYTTLLTDLDAGPATEYGDHNDIPYVSDPGGFRRQFALHHIDDCIERARRTAIDSLETILGAGRDEVEEKSRARAAEAEVSLDAPHQVNLPIDNHMTFIEKGYASGADTEPVPVAVPESSTLHIVHGEHNTVTIQVDPGVYRFSLLPRGLQPPDSRPNWPEP
jgi:hypothetical protein